MHALRSALIRDHLGQSRLADAGFSGDQVEPAPPLTRRAERRLQLGQLAFSSDQLGCRIGSNGLEGMHVAIAPDSSSPIRSYL